MAGINTPYEFPFETVAVSQTGQVLGGTGAKGDYIHRIIINVSTAATSTVTLIDGSTSIALMTATTPIGTYSLELNMRSASGAWSVTTGAGASCICVGRFSA